MEVCSIQVEFVGIDGASPGWAGLMKAVVERVAYTVGETVGARKPSLPPLSVVCIDAALEEIW